MKNALEDVEKYCREILPGYPNYRCLRPKEGPFQDRRFHPAMVSWTMGQPVAFPLLSLYNDWTTV